MTVVRQITAQPLVAPVNTTVRSNYVLAKAQSSKQIQTTLPQPVTVMVASRIGEKFWGEEADCLLQATIPQISISTHSLVEQWWKYPSSCQHRVHLEFYFPCFMLPCPS